MMMKIPEVTVIIREGEVSMDMYKIISGHVELYTGYRTSFFSKSFSKYNVDGEAAHNHKSLH
ncbi:MAG: hypothetical protein K6E70_10580 [Butyrivibrio sp.]|nr:hypothetical protein [Butyrivibrio sp.]